MSSEKQQAAAKKLSRHLAGTILGLADCIDDEKFSQQEAAAIMHEALVLAMARNLVNVAEWDLVAEGTEDVDCLRDSAVVSTLEALSSSDLNITEEVFEAVNTYFN